MAQLLLMFRCTKKKKKFETVTTYTATTNLTSTTIRCKQYAMQEDIRKNNIAI